MGQRRWASTKMSVMEMSGFSETHVQVREAVGKICEDFPDVSSFLALFVFFFFCFFLRLLSESGPPLNLAVMFLLLRD